MCGKSHVAGIATAFAIMIVPIAHSADVSGTGTVGSSSSGGSLSAPGSLATPPVSGAQADTNAQGVITLPKPASRPGLIGTPPGATGAQIGGGIGTQPGQIGIPSTVNDPAMAPLNPDVSADAIVRERQRREAQIRSQ